MLKRLVQWFLQGLVFLVPLALTIYVFVSAFLTIDGWLGLPVPGAGFAITIVGTTLLGALLSSFLLGRILGGLEGLLERLPLAKLVHSSVKDLMSAFVGDKKRFDKPVAVELIPGSGVRALGFVTRETVEGLGGTDCVAVYLPQAYNFAGQLLLVERGRVEFLGAESADVMAFLVSGGVSGK